MYSLGFLGSDMGTGNPYGLWDSLGSGKGCDRLTEPNPTQTQTPTVRNGGQQRKAITIRTNKASGLTARNTNNERMYSDTYKDACSSFATAGKFTAQGWAQLFTDMEESGMSARAWATAHDGDVIRDNEGVQVLTLRFETVNKYFSLIRWAMANLVDEMDEDMDEDEVTVLDVLAKFKYITEIERVKNGDAPKSTKKKSNDPVENEAKRIQKMTPAQQKALRKTLGW